MVSIVHSAVTANNAGQGIRHKAGEDLAKPRGPEKYYICPGLSLLLSFVVDPAVVMCTDRMPTSAFRLVEQ